MDHLTALYNASHFFITDTPARIEVGSYNYWLVAVSYIVVVFAARITFSILYWLRSTSEESLVIGKVAAALSLGAGIWSMHFIGMLAYSMRMEMEYDPLLTALSLLVALVFAYYVIDIVVQQAKVGFARLGGASILLGVGICCMHYIGMSAMKMDADLRYDPAIFALSVAIAIGSSAAAIMLFLHVTQIQNRWCSSFMTISAMVMGVAVCGMHYTGMEAAVFMPWASCRYAAEQSNIELVIGVVGVLCVLIGTSLVATVHWRDVTQANSTEGRRNSKLLVSHYFGFILQFAVICALWLVAWWIHQLASPQGGGQGYNKALHSYSQILLFLIIPGVILHMLNLLILLQTNRLMAVIEQQRSFNQSVLNAIPDPIFVKNVHHKWVAANNAFWHMLGGTKEMFIGLGDEDVFKSEESKIFHEKDNQVIHSGSIISNEENISPHQGPNITVVTTKSPIVLPDGGKGLVGIIHDISALKIAETELAKHRDHLQKLVEVQVARVEEEKLTVTLMQNAASIANEALSIKDALRPILTLLCYYLRMQLGHAFVRDEKTGDLVSSDAWFVLGEGQFDELITDTANVRARSELGIIGTVFKSKAPLWVNSDGEQPILQSEYRRFPSHIKTAIVFPLVEGGKVKAVFELYANEAIAEQTGVLSLLGYICDQLVLVVERERGRDDIMRAMFNEKKANQLKSEFLANISHELRTPMHSIITFSRQGIERIDRWDKPEQQENLTLIRQSGERLLLLINDLLDLSKLESGSMEYCMAIHPMETLIQQAVQHLQALVRDKNLQIKFEFSGGDPNVACDSGKITQVLLNLLSNAIKYAPCGSVVQIEGTRDQRVGCYRLTVSDEGVGIPEDELESVFDKFVQSSKTKTNAGGTGLGLAICRQIVMGHQGKIWARNRASGGTSVCFELPINVKPNLEYAV